MQPLHFGQDQIALLAPVGVRQPRGLQVARRDADGRQRRAQVVGERRQQRRFQLFVAARNLRRLAFLEELRALDGDRREARDGVERPRLDRAAGGRQEADGFGAEAERDDVDDPSVDMRRGMAGIRARARVEFQSAGHDGPGGIRRQQRTHC